MKWKSVTMASFSAYQCNHRLISHCFSSYHQLLMLYNLTCASRSNDRQELHENLLLPSSGKKSEFIFASTPIDGANDQGHVVALSSNDKVVCFRCVPLSDLSEEELSPAWRQTTQQETFTYWNKVSAVLLNFVWKGCQVDQRVSIKTHVLDLSHCL